MKLIDKLRAHPDFDPRSYYARWFPNLNGTGPRAYVRCPFHEDRNPSFSINLDSTSPHYGRWKCWSACDAGGDVFDFEARKRGTTCSDKTFWRDLAKEKGIEGADDMGRYTSSGREDTKTAAAEPKKNKPKGDWSIQEFAEGKGLTLEALEKARAIEIQHGTKVEICFPMLNLLGEKVGHRRRFKTGQVLTNKGGKTGLYFPKQFNKKAKRLFVMEGETDFAATMMVDLDAIGIPGAGKCSEMVVEVARRLKCEVVIAADNDPIDPTTGRRPGLDGANKLLQALNQAEIKTKLWVMPKEGQDFRDWMIAGGNKEEVLRIVEALPAAKLKEYLCESLGPNADEREPTPPMLARDFLYMQKSGLGGSEGEPPRIGDLVRLRFWRGEYFEFFSGQGWQPVDIEEIRAELWKFSEAFLCRGGPTRSKINNALDGLKAEVILGAKLDMPMWLTNNNLNGAVPTQAGRYVPVKNGLLDTEKNALGEETPLLFSRNILPVDFIPESTCGIWLEFLDETFDGDESRMKLLQEFFGYNLIPDNRYQRFLMMHGEGSNGKSQVFEVIKRLLGMDNISGVPLEQFGERFGLHPTVGKLLNICPDVAELDRAAEGAIKSFASGDLITIDRKHLKPLTIVPTTKLWLSCNNLPRFSDRSQGIWRRLALMPFNRVTPLERQIPDLGKHLFKEESSGILNWTLEGLRRLKAQGRFTDSAIGRKAESQYQMESNPARAFLMECFVEDEKGKIARSVLYKKYSEWCEENGFKRLNSAHFGREICKVFPKAFRSSVVLPENQKRVNGYGGIEFREWAEMDQQLGLDDDL